MERERTPRHRRITDWLMRVLAAIAVAGAIIATALRIQDDEITDTQSLMKFWPLYLFVGLVAVAVTCSTSRR